MFQKRFDINRAYMMIYALACIKRFTIATLPENSLRFLNTNHSKIFGTIRQTIALNIKFEIPSQGNK